MSSDPESLARATLNAARQSSKARKRRRPVDRKSGYSGPAADSRDPQTAGSLVSRLIEERGWETPVASGTVFGAWNRVVGPDISEKCRPVALKEGELTLEAVSTAWATQLRLLARMLLAKIARVIGDGVVKHIVVRGPAAPSWKKGPLAVAGRGPRDTYG